MGEKLSLICLSCCELGFLFLLLKAFLADTPTMTQMAQGTCPWSSFASLSSGPRLRTPDPEEKEWKVKTGQHLPNLTSCASPFLFNCIYVPAVQLLT